MIYKTRFHSTFYDVNDNKIDIKIYKNVDADVAVEDEELTLSADAVSIKYVSDDIFQPLKQSGCTINVLTKNILTDLYTGELNKVTVKVFKNDMLFWFGFLTPNIYSSEFESDLDLLQLEFVDVVSNLENVKFSKSDNSISSFYDIIAAALQRIDTEFTINEVYLHNSLTIDNSHDVLNKLYIQERNFYDESEEPQTYKDVIEDILRYLGMTLIQHKDRYYLIDYEALKGGNYSFTRYNLTVGNTLDVTLDEDKRTLGTIGVSSANASISMGNVYNQISIVANNNPLNDIIPELFNELVNQNADANKYYSTTTEKNTYLTAYFNSSDWLTNGIYTGAITYTKITEATLPLMLDAVDGITKGTVFQKNDNYTTEDGEPSTLNWSDYLTMIATNTLEMFGVEPEEYSVKTTRKSILYKGGYFIIDIEYMLSQHPVAANSENGGDVVFYNGQYSSGFLDTKFKAKLQIGNLYYNGKEWTTTESYFYLCRKNKVDERIFNTLYHLTNKVSYTENLVESGDGVLIKLPDGAIFGDLNFELFRPNSLGLQFSPRTDKNNDYSRATYCHIKDITLNYTTKNTTLDLFNKDKADSDVLYKNVINSDNITELDDITMRVNTYSPVAASYSYVMKKSGSNYDYVDTLSKYGHAINSKMEVFNIGKYVDHYSKPKFIYTNTLHNKNILPYSIISIKTLNKDMFVDGITYDLKNDSADVNLKEV